MMSVTHSTTVRNAQSTNDPYAKVAIAIMKAAGIEVDEEKLLERYEQYLRDDWYAVYDENGNYKRVYR